MSKASLTQELEQAQAARGQQKYEQALQHYRNVLTQISGNTVDPVRQDLRFAALQGQGEVLHILGRQEDSLASYQSFYEEANTSKQKITALVLKGNQQSNMGHQSQAINTLTEALQLAQSIQDKAGQAQAYGGIGSAQHDLGRLEDSVDNLLNALRLFQQMGDRYKQSRSWNRLGITYMSLGKVDKSIDAFANALNLVRPLGVRETAIVLNNLGEAYQQLFDMEQALEAHQEALALVEATELRMDAADFYRNLGVDLIYLERLEEGLNHLYTALKLSEETGRWSVQMQTLYSLALAEIDRGELDEGLAYAERLMEQAKERKTRAFEAEAMHAIGLYYEKTDDLPKAEQLWQQASFLAHETEQRSILWQLHAGLAHISPNEGLRAVHYRIAAEVIEQIAYPIEDATLRQKFLNAAAVRRVLDQTRG